MYWITPVREERQNKVQSWEEASRYNRIDTPPPGDDKVPQDVLILWPPPTS